MIQTGIASFEPALLLAALRLKNGWPAVQGLDESRRILALVLLGVGVCGFALLALGIALRKSDEVDPPPPHLSGEAEARTGLWVVLAGLPFLVIAVVALGMGAEPGGLIVLPVATLVFAAWGGGRVLIAAGGTADAARELIACGICVLFSGSLAGALGFLLIERAMG